MVDKQVGAIRPNPSGLCMCGCGRKTKIATKSDRRHGHVMGQPFRFIHGHLRSPLKGPNRFKLRRGRAVIFLERRDGTVLECLVSRKDFDRVSHHWYVDRNGKRCPHGQFRDLLSYRFFGLFVCPVFFFERFFSNATGCFGSYSPMAPPPGSDIVVRAPTFPR